ncbi:MAG: redoxin domain-containing protein [Planctomycetes bacterium]|nr:redoxin domain-containing protein [Planctomycetota bacterium]
MVRIILSSLLVVIGLIVSVAGQEAPDAPEEKQSYTSYEELFAAFDKQRQVLMTRWDRLQEQQDVKPEDIRKIEDDLKALDLKYADALEGYIGGNPNAKDLFGARFELVVALSRIDEKLARAVEVADEFLKHHKDSEPAGDVRFLKGQTLFRMEGREEAALDALDDFLAKHPDRADARPARMMRIRTLLFLDRVADAQRALKDLLKRKEVKDDDEAEKYLQTMLDALDWVGKELPAFKRPDLKGEIRSADALKGKPTLLFVWDSNSGACLGELPFVQDAHKKYAENVNFLSISVNESQPALEQWLERNPEAIGFPTLWIDRDEENSVLRKLDVSLIPFLVLVDSAGKIYRYDVRSDDMLRYVAKLAGE